MANFADSRKQLIDLIYAWRNAHNTDDFVATGGMGVAGSANTKQAVALHASIKGNNQFAILNLIKEVVPQLPTSDRRKLLAFSDLFLQNEDSAVSELSEVLAILQDGGESVTQSAGGSATPQTTQSPPAVVLKAYAQFSEAIQINPNLAKHGMRRKAWEAAKAAAKVDGEEIQSFETWDSYVRTALRAAKTDKNG